MAKTIYDKLGSQDILSAHINGLGYTINNLETALNMSTKSVTDIALEPVTDMDNASVRYRIYEGSIRSWVKGTAIIKRNGEVVDSSEYLIQESFGVIVFHVQQNASDNITVTTSYIGNGSTRLDNIETKIQQVEQELETIDNLEEEITSINGNVSELKQEDINIKARLTKLETSGGSSGGSSGSSGETLTDIAIDGYMAGGGQLTDGKLVIPKGDIWITHTTSDAPAISTAIAVAANTIDAFPIYVSQRVVIDKVKIKCTKVNQSGAKNMIAIYSTANGVPHRRLAQTEPTADVVGEMELSFKEGTVRLEEGIYWIARFCNAGSQYDGLASTNAIPLSIPSDMTQNGSGTPHGIRATYGNDAIMPFEFPMSSAQALARTGYASPYLHIIKSYV